MATLPDNILEEIFKQLDLLTLFDCVRPVSRLFERKSYLAAFRYVSNVRDLDVIPVCRGTANPLDANIQMSWTVPDAFGRREGIDEEWMTTKLFAIDETKAVESQKLPDILLRDRWIYFHCDLLAQALTCTVNVQRSVTITEEDEALPSFFRALIDLPVPYPPSPPILTETSEEKYKDKDKCYMA
ncbi:hypothetical protein HK097_007490 [Rhizophlyctis rosea]|uniref:F-box domain-containing protein n=1 Tax=Rhizophlyctis rosea TaxID=64517 RepID=A0AAD5X8N2_9FUNG|nr:hypothetical protein HK097_007490 [Rhizophlyctis rosea]